ncbi:MAG: amidohydrolase family protein [Terriglobales bacterium]
MSTFQTELTRRKLLLLGALAYPGKVFMNWNSDRKALPSMNIDIYTHFFPPAYAKEITRRATRTHPDVPNIEMLMRLFPNLCEFETRLAHMDRYETSLQVLTPLPIPADLFVADSAAAAALVRVANDALAEAIAKRQDRFAGVALLCFLDPEEAANELERTVRHLGLKGAMLFTNIGGRPVDMPQLFPVYERAQGLDVPLWIHPISWNYYDWVRDYLIWQIFGWPIDTTLAMARLVYGGVLEKFPKLKFITHHAGGTTPYLIGRVIDTYDQNEELMRLSGSGSSAPRSAAKKPIDYYRMFYGDTALSGIASAMSCAFEMFGSERLVFGSDYPFGPDSGQRFIHSNLTAVDTLRLPDRDRRRILVENARSLLGLKQA